MASAPVGDPFNLEQFTIDELLLGLPSTKVIKERGREVVITRSPFEQAVLDELWSRYYKILRRRLSAKVFATGSTLCPSQEPDRENFIDEVLARSRDVHVRLTVKGEFTRRGRYKNFFSYLSTMVMKLALTYRRELIGLRKVTVRDSSGKVIGHKLVGDEKPVPVSIDEQPDPPASDPNLDPVRIIIRKILDDYPPEHAESYRNLDRIVVQGWTYEELADQLTDLGPQVEKIDDIRKFEEEDRAKLKIRLQGYEGASF